MIYKVQIGQDRREILSRRIILCLLPPTAGRAQPARVFQLLPATSFATMKSKVVVGRAKKILMMMGAMMMMMVQAM